MKILTACAAGLLTATFAHADGVARSDADAERLFYETASAALIEHDSGSDTAIALDDAAYEALFQKAAARALDEVLQDSASASLK